MEKEKENDYDEEDLRGMDREKKDLKYKKYEEIIKEWSEEIEKDEKKKMEDIVIREKLNMILGEKKKELSELEDVIENVDENVKLRVNEIIKRE